MKDDKEDDGPCVACVMAESLEAALDVLRAIERRRDDGTVVEDRSTVGYSPGYASGWERTFRREAN